MLLSVLGAVTIAACTTRSADSVPGIVGYEYDRLGDEASRPAGLQVVGRTC